MSRIETAEKKTSADKSAKGQLIRSTEGIYRLLKRLEGKHTPVKINFQSVADSYTSMVIGVNFKEGYFLLDEVTPKWGDDLMKRATPFRFDSFHDGCKISGSEVRAEGRAIKDGSPIYKIPFPESLFFLQRRQHFRASIRSSLLIRMRLGKIVPPEKLDEFGQIIPQQTTWQYEGRLRDLSAHGCQVELNGDLSDRIRNADRFEGCLILFPNQKTSIELNLIVRHVGLTEDQQTTQLGCEFQDLSSALDQQLSFAVAELQRDQARVAAGNTGGQASELLTAPEGSEEAAPAASGTARKKKAVLSTEAIHANAVEAVTSLINELREKQPLSIKLIWAAARQLLEALESDHDQLLLLSRVRTGKDYIAEHSVSVALLLADQTAFDRKNPKHQDKSHLSNLIFAGLCHDLGKGLIPERIISKQGELTPQEAKVMQKHSLLTREILSRQQGAPEVALTLATQNCERLDGSGFPEKLKGFGISPLGKLGAVIDVFDAMTSDRTYRRGIPPALAYKRLLGMKEQLDLASVQLLIKNQGIFPIGSLVSFANGDLGFVQSLDDDRMPQKVRLVYNKNQSAPFSPKDIQVGEAEDWSKITGPEDPGRYQLSNRVLLEAI